MSVETNKKVARLYHDLNPDDIEEILTPDFIGHGSKGLTWNRDSHGEFWRTPSLKVKDAVHEQVAEGDWVATRFTRTGTNEGKPVNEDIMNFKRFADGKIAELWEVFSSK